MLMPLPIEVSSTQSTRHGNARQRLASPSPWASTNLWIAPHPTSEASDTAMTLSLPEAGPNSPAYCVVNFPVTCGCVSICVRPHPPHSNPAAPPHQHRPTPPSRNIPHPKHHPPPHPTAPLPAPWTHRPHLHHFPRRAKKSQKTTRYLTHLTHPPPARPLATYPIFRV